MDEQKHSFGDWMKAWGKFFTSAYFIKNILIYIGTIIVFFLLVVLGLKWYTRHNEQISVPSVENMTIQEAEQLLRSRKLNPQVIDCTYNSSVKPGHVIPGGQQPVAGYAVKEGRTVYLTYMAYGKEPTSMPRIVGESIETAKSELARCGLILGKVTEEKGHANVHGAKYKGAAISAGQELHKGDVIDLVVGKGDEDDEESGQQSDSFNSLGEEF